MRFSEPEPRSRARKPTQVVYRLCWPFDGVELFAPGDSLKSDTVSDELLPMLSLPAPPLGLCLLVDESDFLQSNHAWSHHGTFGSQFEREWNTLEFPAILHGDSGWMLNKWSRPLRSWAFSAPMALEDYDVAHAAHVTLQLLSLLGRRHSRGKIPDYRNQPTLA